MLTAEVVKILKKSFILFFALAFTLCSHLRASCDFTVDGRRIDTGCSLKAASLAHTAALAAAEEILPGAASLPDYSRHLRLTFSRPAEKAPLLTDALLCAADGVMRGSCIYVDGLRLGAVEDAEDFRAEFSRYIDNTLPTWANSGFVRGLSLTPRYTRSEFALSNDDMILLVTGLSPVMYTDGMGRISPV